MSEPSSPHYIKMEKEGAQEDGSNQRVSSTLVSNGYVNSHGEIADKEKTGGWKSSPYIIVNEVAERLTFYSISVHMVSYLVTYMHLSVPQAATRVTDWVGAAYFLTLVGAYLADGYLGRFKTIVVFSLLYVVGMVFLTLSASVDSLHPPPCVGKVCKPATQGQQNFLSLALILIAFGTGGIKPCVSSFGADQFDEADEKETLQKFSFFNWFFFAINMGALMGITVMVYVQLKGGWIWGFGVPTFFMLLSIVILLLGYRYYRFQKPLGSAFTRFAQVIVVSFRNHFSGVEVSDAKDLYEVTTTESAIIGARKLPHTRQFRFLDKAAVRNSSNSNSSSRWSICTVTQVEEFKAFLRILPVWATTIALSISYCQLSTFFITQAMIMDRRLPGTNLVIPTGTVPIFSAVNPLILVPIYEGYIVPILRKYTGNHRGITSLQRMGVGLFISIFAMLSAAVVEGKRRSNANPLSVSVFWLLPQFFLVGSSEVFTYVGQMEFFYDEATDGTRSISSALFLCEVGIGSWLSTIIVETIARTTGGEEKGWLRNDLNRSRLDYFYWVLTVINVVNFIAYVTVAWFFKSRNADGIVRDEAITTEGEDVVKHQ